MRGPHAIIAELTHRCPLHCVYCSNPLAMQPQAVELTTEEWVRAFGEAAAMGALQLHLTGGEPLLRSDLVELVASARSAKLYVNLITSGIGLGPQRLEALVAAGVDHIQLSFQDVEEDSANLWAGLRSHARKLEIAAMIRRCRVGFTVNIVVHRNNLDRLERMIAMAEELCADKVEIANVQYYGWAFRNTQNLLPSREQLGASIEIVTAAQERLKGRMRVDFVLPDYYAKYPKPCMGGWGRSLMLIDPAGRALPCHAAGVIPGLTVDRIQDRSVRWIWEESESFNRFRGQDWMSEPCRSCDRREQDFGGCRCQAFLLAGDASLTDPTCSLSPHHGVVESILTDQQAAGPFRIASGDELIYRIDPR